MGGRWRWSGPGKVFHRSKPMMLSSFLSLASGGSAPARPVVGGECFGKESAWLGRAHAWGESGGDWRSSRLREVFPPIKANDVKPFIFMISTFGRSHGSDMKSKKLLCVAS